MIGACRVSPMWQSLEALQRNAISNPRKMREIRKGMMKLNHSFLVSCPQSKFEMRCTWLLRVVIDSVFNVAGIAHFNNALL
jgi:hypothetical protein